MYQIPEAARQHFIDSASIMRRTCERRFWFLPPHEREEAYQNSLGTAWMVYPAYVRHCESYNSACVHALKYAIRRTKQGFVLGSACERQGRNDIRWGIRRGRMTNTCGCPDGLQDRSVNVPLSASIREALPRFIDDVENHNEWAFIVAMMEGATLREAAQRAGVSYNRVKQFRLRLKRAWRAWHSGN